MIKEFHVSKNLLPRPASSKNETINDVTFNLDKNGVCTINGTASANTTFTYDLSEEYTVPISIANGGTGAIYLWNSQNVPTVAINVYYNNTLIDNWYCTPVNRVSSSYAAMANKTINKLSIYIPQGASYNGTISFMISETGQIETAYEPYGNTWNTKSYAKSISGEQTYTKFPIVLRTTEQSIPIWSMDGNTKTSGTASPQNPVDVNGVGVRTKNLLDYSFVTSTRYVTVTPITNGINLAGTYFAEINIALEVGTTYYMSWAENIISGSVNTMWRVQYTDDTYSTFINSGVAFTPEKEIAKVLFYVNSTNTQASVDITNLMLNTGTAPLPYEPHGYKIPLSSNGTALSPMYLTEQLMKIDDTADSLVSTGTATYQIGSYELTGQENWYIYEAAAATPYPIYQFYTSGLNLNGNSGESAYCTIAPYGFTTSTRQNGEYGAYMVSSGADIGLQMYGSKSQFPDVTAWQTYLQQQYANGTPVTVWYILATPTTETVTVPSIPTTSGLNTIDVNTSVKPSKMSLTYDGYKICRPKKKSANLSNNQTITSERYSIAVTSGNLLAALQGLPAGTYTCSWTYRDNRTSDTGVFDQIRPYTGSTSLGVYINNGISFNWTSEMAQSVNILNCYFGVGNTDGEMKDFMLVSGSEAKPYKPYWE